MPDETRPSFDPDAVPRLVRAAVAGDRAALESLLEHYMPSLRAYVRVRATPELRRRENESDIVQSVCREVLVHGDRFRFEGESAFRNWLFATALRKILDRREFHHAQKRDVARDVASSEARDAQLLATYSSLGTPSSFAILHEEVARFESALDALPEDYREVIVQHRLLGRTHAEIAASLERTEGAVRVLLHRALARLSTLLAPE
jgi:RNA polymerase sigma-70 factor (ECF subfamily)